MNNDPLGPGLPDGNDQELALLYQLGIALASGKDLFTTLHTLQTAILKLIQAQAMFIAIYDEASDMVDFPIYFEVGEPERQPSRRLRENPGLTGAVIYSGKSLYLPDMMIDEVVGIYAPVEDDRDLVLHTFLGIPLMVNDKVIGVLSVQTVVAYRGPAVAADSATAWSWSVGTPAMAAAVAALVAEVSRARTASSAYSTTVAERLDASPSTTQASIPSRRKMCSKVRVTVVVPAPEEPVIETTGCRADTGSRPHVSRRSERALKSGLV